MKQAQRSVVTFMKPKKSIPVFAAAVIVMLCLIAGLVIALSAQIWALSVILLVAVVALGTYAFLHIRESQKLIAGENNRRIVCDIAKPDEQRAKLFSQIDELASVLNTPDSDRSELLSAYIVAEDLALRQIQQEARYPISRHIAMNGTSFDAMLVRDDVITLIETTFLVQPDLSRDRVVELLQKAAHAKKTVAAMKNGARVRLLCLLITQLDKEAEDQLRASLVTKFADTPVDVDIRLFDFEALQRVYAM